MNQQEDGYDSDHDMNFLIGRDRHSSTPAMFTAKSGITRKFSLPARLLIVGVVFGVMLFVLLYNAHSNKTTDDNRLASQKKLSSSTLENIVIQDSGDDYNDGYASTVPNNEEQNRLRVLNQWMEGGGHDDSSIFSYGTNNIKRKYSKMQFHNSFLIDQNQEDMSQASFILENVCLNQRGELLYFTTRDLFEKFYNGNLLKFSDSKKIGFLQTWRNGVRGSVNLHFMIDKQLPSMDIIRWVEQPVAAMVRYAVGNVGHVMADNLIALNEMISKFGLDSNDVMILFMDEIFYRDDSLNNDLTCSNDLKRQVELLAPNHKSGTNKWCIEEMASYNYNKSSSVKYSLQWSQMITKYPILQKCSYVVTDPKDQPNQSIGPMINRIEKAPCPMDDPSSKKRPDYLPMNQLDQLYGKKRNFNESLEYISSNIDTCFRKLLIGVGDRPFVLSRDFARFRDLAVAELRKKILVNMGYFARSKVDINDREFINIGIHDKPKSGTHGNSLHNFEELLNTIQSRIMHEPFILTSKKKVNVHAVRLEDMSSVKQVELFSEMDIYMGTVGSASYYGLLMPQNSHLLLPPVCLRNNSPNGWYCVQPTIHYHTSLPHLTVVNVMPTVKNCHFRPDMGWCDAELDADKIYEAIISILKMRLL